ncbi:MAG: hypothetical protein ACI4MQ_04880 [Candidatus Coproplasma sp.]
MKAEGFTLEVNFIYYKKEIAYINYINYYFAKIAVSSSVYSGKTEFIVSEEECTNFVKSLTELFESLKVGDVGISDYEPDQNNLCFDSDGRGNFTISGVFIIGEIGL